MEPAFQISYSTWSQGRYVGICCLRSSRLAPSVCYSAKLHIQGSGTTKTSNSQLCNITTYWYLFAQTKPAARLNTSQPVLSAFRSILRVWSWASMQMWGKIPVLDTLAVWVTMRQMLRLLLIGAWICSSLMAATWTGLYWEKVSF